MKIIRIKQVTKFLALVATLAGTAVAQIGGAHAPVTTTKATVSSSLQGVTGGIAVNKFGDVFQASTWEGKVYEFPASGGAPIVLLQYGTNANYSGKGLGGVAVDANQNLYVTTIYVGAQTSTDSAIYEIPYVNGSYPAGYTLNAPVAQCGANSTVVCAWGNFLQPAGYYYQGWDFAIDGNGVGYLVTLTGNNNTGANDIYACNAACETRAQNGTVLVSNWANPVLSIVADFAGDLFFADGSSSVYEVAAGTSTPVAVGTGFNTTVGVAVDQAGNLYVTDSKAIYEIPRSAAGTYSAATTVEIVGLAGATVRGYNGGGVAVDLHGNLYAASGYTNLFKYAVNHVGFAGAATGSGNSTAAVTVTLNEAASGVSVTPTGTEAAEFAVSANTCGTGGAAGASCGFTATFSPAGVGLRGAALKVAGAGGHSLAVAASGVGQGAGLTIDPGTSATIATSLKKAAGVAYDNSGNLFVADTSASTVYEYAGGTGAAVSIGTGLVSPTGVATDAAGNLYIADLGGNLAAKGRVVEVPNVAGVLTNGSQTVVATGLGAPQGLIVDASGTLYVADSANKYVLALPQAQFGQAGGATFGSGLSGPTDVAVDTSGNLYIADPAGNQVVKISQEGLQSVVGSGFSAPTGLTLDASGSVIVADQGNKRLVRVPNEGGLLNANDEVSIFTGISAPYAVRGNVSGSLAVTDNSTNLLETLNRTTGLSAFSSVNVGTTSSAQTVYLSNEGNLPLSFNTPLYTPPASPFALVSGTPPCTAGSTLAVAYACDLSATFSPTLKGPATSSVPFATSALNAATPSLTLQGTGLFLATATVSLQQTSPAGAPVYGQTVTLTANAGGTAAAGGTPTGTVSLVIDGSLQPSVPLLNGSASLTVSSLTGGPHTLEVEYSGDTNYAAGHSSVLTISVTPSTSSTTLVISATATTPLSAASGDAVTFSSTLTPGAPGFFSGTVSYMSGSTVLATAAVAPGPNGTYTASVNATALPVGSYQVVAVYGGNANYTGSSSSPAIALTIVSVPTIAITPSSPTITTSLAAPGSTTVNVNSLAGFQGAVDFACTGLPVNAVCQFNPATLTLLASNSGNPSTVPAITTTLTVLVDQPPLVTPTAIWPWTALLLLVPFFALRRSRKALSTISVCLALLLISGIGLSGCSSTAFTTPTGTSTIKVTATATPSVPATAPTSSTGTVTSTFTVSLTVK